MLKVLQGGLRISLTTAATSASTTYFPGKGVVVDATGKVATPVAADVLTASIRPPIGLIFDDHSELGSNATATGGGGGSSTSIYSTGNTQANITVITGQFLAEINNDDNTVIGEDIALTDCGTAVMIVGSDVAATAGTIKKLASQGANTTNIPVGIIVGRSAARTIKVLFNFPSNTHPTIP